MSVEVRWQPPDDLSAAYIKTRIERGSVEQGPYNQIHELDTYDVSNDIVTSWVDMNGVRTLYYVVRFYDPIASKTTDFVIGYFPFTPRETRLVDYVKNWVPDILVPDLNDQAYSLAFRFSLNSFNVHPPETSYTIDTFPMNYEHFLIMGAQVNLAMLKYLKLGVRDFSYGDMGFSLNIDRGTKITKAAEDIGKIYQGTIAMAKWNFTSMGVGLGSMPLPVSMGAQVSRGLLNVLDLMTAMSR